MITSLVFGRCRTMDLGVGIVGPVDLTRSADLRLERGGIRHHANGQRLGNPVVLPAVFGEPVAAGVTCAHPLQGAPAKSSETVPRRSAAVSAARPQ